MVAPVLPVAYLPGAAGRVALWRRIAERLARRRPSFLCEYPGFGNVPADPSLACLSDLRAHLLRSLPERFDLVAMSAGGSIALRLALDHPERVRKLVLVATSSGVDVRALGALDWRDTYQTLHPDAPPWFVEDASDVTAELPRLQAPTLLVFGDADLIAPVAVGEFLLRRLPNARLEVIPRATHDLQKEFPDLLASLIEAHLRRDDPPAS
ncbi:MAG TPA: alpha/beta hydrolase [Polyangiaceae bacterium]|nr:alpha/beta hydrolase [Polyangiaceae bacterium]